MLPAEAPALATRVAIHEKSSPALESSEASRTGFMLIHEKSPRLISLNFFYTLGGDIEWMGLCLPATECGTNGTTL